MEEIKIMRFDCMECGFLSRCKYGRSYCPREKYQDELKGDESNDTLENFFKEKETSASNK